MKSFLRRKQAQVIAALVIAIAVWTTVVGLGLSTGIARAAPTTTKLTINSVAHLSGSDVSVTIKLTCNSNIGGDLQAAAHENAVIGSVGDGNVIACSPTVNNGTTTKTVDILPRSGSFTRGKAQVAAVVVGANVLDARVVKIIR